MGLEDLRGEIDRVDREILRLLAERLEVARRIGGMKRAAGVAPYDPLRERAVLDALVREGASRFPAEGLRSIYREIISASRTLESDRPICYLGAPGGLTHHAARGRFGESAPLVPCGSAERIFERLDSGETDAAVLTLESGSMEAHLDRFDLFLHTESRIFGEFYVEPRLALFAQPDARPETVYAHPAALAGCSHWVERSSQRTRFIAVGTGEEAADRAIRENAGALGYGIIASLFGLVPVEEEIGDDPRLTRRFLLLGRRDGARSGRDKTSLIAVIPNRPGALHRIAGVLASHGVNLCWIEPKETRLGAWDHIFFLDLEGHQEDGAIQSTLRDLREVTEFIRLLGSYPSERPPGRKIG